MKSLADDSQMSGAWKTLRPARLLALIILLGWVIGLPVFHGGSAGIPIILGPTGGYLVSFPIATLVGGSISRTVAKSRKMDLFKVVTGFAVALIIIYSLGTIWLMEYAHLTLTQALLAGTAPFIGFDILKAIVAAPVAVRLRSTRFDLPVRRSPKPASSIPATQVPRE